MTVRLPHSGVGRQRAHGLAGRKPTLEAAIVVRFDNPFGPETAVFQAPGVESTNKLLSHSHYLKHLRYVLEWLPRRRFFTLNVRRRHTLSLRKNFPPAARPTTIPTRLGR